MDTDERVDGLSAHRFVRGIYSFLFFVIHSRPFYLEQFRRTRWVLWAQGDRAGFSWFVGAANTFWRRISCGFCRSCHFANAPNVALAAARVQGSESVRSCIRYLVAVEKWRAAERCASTCGAIGNRHTRRKGN